ncbi:MAG: sigma-70 family RNA polymerase sigma factor [Succiniclasticum sp.]|jgi:RNA polymerase sporulation-specific sigma factor|nr:sigma-70 family RNA polymerase sigma factor [Succiniclasticum sp.]MEE3478727.1 sigma-70 family RNA polymerase sigma factor [Succiniclasticum sp.]
MLPAYLAELKKVKLLAPEEERALWEAEKAGDGEAHQKLMASYQPLVFKIAVSFRLTEEVTMELIQEGMVGLLEAAESYDYTRGVAFSLFAMHRIRGRMCDFLTREHANEFLSLDWESENGSTLADFLPSQQPVPEEIAERHAVSARVCGAVERLPGKEREVLRGLFLDNRSPADLADSIHVSTNHVYRLEKKGVQRVRGMLSRFMSDFHK